jgi:hypothetical protein
MYSLHQMNSSFLDRSMDTINFNKTEFLEPQMKVTRKPAKIKVNNHLDRIFDQTTINPHFSGNQRDMMVSFRPEVSFNMDQEKSTEPIKRPVQQQQQQQHQQQQQPNTKQTSCQYCDSYRKKNINYETMIAKYQKQMSELTTKLNVNSEEKKKYERDTGSIRSEYEKINNQLKHKQKETEILEKKISSIQLDQTDKDKSRIESEIKKSNEKYYKMSNHYEKIIGELRKEIITLTTPDPPDPIVETSMESRLIPLLCTKLNKTEDEIKEKLVNYTLPEKLTPIDLKNILELYK